MEMTATQIAMNDTAFRARAYSAVSRAMADFMLEYDGRLGADRTIDIRDVNDVALNAVALALKEAFESNPEIVRLQHEAESYKKLALKLNETAPFHSLSITLPTQT